MSATGLLAVPAIAMMLAAAPRPAGAQAHMPDVQAIAQADATAALRAEGRALYRGSTPWRRPPTLHGVALAADAQACAACHGARGAARTEAGVAVPSIQWERLMQATPARPAYAGAPQVLRALMQGRASDGRALDAPMPRFGLDPREQQALAAYLRVLGTEADPVPGVEARRIVLGSVLPLSGPSQAVGERIRSALLQRIDLVNAAGGIFGRQLELVVADAGPTAASASTAAIAMVRGGRVFALVASLLPAPDEALRRALAAHDVAMVATLGLPLVEPSEPRLSYLLASLAQQSRALAAELRRRCAAPGAASPAPVVLHPPGNALAAVLGGIADDGWQLRPVADEAQLRAALREASGRPTIALLPAPLAAVARDELARRSEGRGACLGTLAALSGEAPASTPAAVRELVALPMPPVPLPGGADSSAALWPLLADAALAATAEALARAGRQLDTAGLVAALDTLHRFEPRPGLPVGFSPRQRHGIDLTYLWKEPSP